MHTNAVLHIIFPLTDVLISVWEDHRALAFFLSRSEVAFVHATVFERELAFSLEQVLRELPFVRPLGLGEVVHARALENTVYEVAFIVASVGPFISAMAIFLTLVIFALEFNLAFIPGLAAISMLEIIDPIAVVGRALGVYKRAIAVRHAVRPLSLIHATVCLCHPAVAFHLVLPELALIL